MYVTARATPARRGIDHNAKQKTLLKRSFAKPLWSNIRWVFLFDALCGMFNTRVRGGCRRARSPHANVLCEQSQASKADATNVARMSGGRAISRFLSRERKLCKESGLSRTPRWACVIDAFEKSLAKPLWKKFHWGFSFARKKARQRKRIVAPLRCRGLIDLFFAQQYAASPGFARSKQRSILCM